MLEELNRLHKWAKDTDIRDYGINPPEFLEELEILIRELGSNWYVGAGLKVQATDDAIISVEDNLAFVNWSNESAQAYINKFMNSDICFLDNLFYVHNQAVIHCFTILDLLKAIRSKAIIFEVLNCKKEIKND